MAEYSSEAIACTETLFILNMLEKEYYDKAPLNFINFLEENSIKYYQYFDNNGEVKMSQLTRDFLSYLNLEYWSSEEEKKELIEIYKENSKKNHEKYDVFHDSKKLNNKVETKEENLTVVKESIWRKIINKLKNFFLHN